MVDFGFAFKRPFQDFNKYVLGAIIGLVPILNFALMGYSLDCARLTLKNKKDLPEWKIGENFMQGISYICVFAIYSLPSLVFIAVGIILMILKRYIAGSAAIALGLIYSLFAIPLMYAAIIRFVETDRFSSIYELRTIAKKGYTWTMISTILAMMIISMLIGVVVNLLPIAGFIAYIALAPFFLAVFTFTLLAMAYKEA